jgi:hypothetical protein
MIKQMIKRIRRRIGWQGEQPAATEDPERMYRGFDCSARSPRGSPAVRTRAGLVRMRSRVQSQRPALLADLSVIPS